MFCELGDKSPIPANPISFGAITIAPLRADHPQRVTENVGMLELTLRFLTGQIKTWLRWFHVKFMVDAMLITVLINFYVFYLGSTLR